MFDIVKLNKKSRDKKFLFNIRLKRFYKPDTNSITSEKDFLNTTGGCIFFS